MKSSILNASVFYSLRFIAIFYLLAMVMILLMGIGNGSFVLVMLGFLFIGAFMYLFYRASEEAKRGTHLGRILTGVCSALFFISFLMGNGEGMRWLGLLLSCFWCYRVVYWQYG